MSPSGTGIRSGSIATLTAALLDPLLRHAHLVQNAVDNNRLADRRKAGTKPAPKRSKC